MTVGSQKPVLDPGDLLIPPQYKIGSQNTSYKLELKFRFLNDLNSLQTFAFNT